MVGLLRTPRFLQDVGRLRPSLYRSFLVLPGEPGHSDGIALTWVQRNLKHRCASFIVYFLPTGPDSVRSPGGSNQINPT